MTGQRPSVGRIVHYLSRGSADGRFPPACRAAVITEVCDDPEQVTNMPREQLENLPNEPVSLAVLNPTGLFFDEYIEHDADAMAPGTWHWPERVEEKPQTWELPPDPYGDPPADAGPAGP